MNLNEMHIIGSFYMADIPVLHELLNATIALFLMIASGKIVKNM